ncbi:MAG: hypothetical protein J6L76_07370 [Clostridia bacterium]|nr:hypothetical protein [Clostridia bacterium]
MSSDIPITKENLDTYLKEVAKQFRKLNKKAIPADITLIGGASILINYGFRDSTYDADALIQASSAMKDAINYVTDTFGLPNGWLNEDFKNTRSYTPRLIQYSKHYRTFSNIVNIRTITGEYLVAMKLMASRKYKHDISDIVGILCEHEKRGSPLTFEQIDKAVTDLYDSWEKMPEDAQVLIHSILENEDMDALYKTYANEEAAAKNALITFDDQYPDALTENNLDEILNHLLERQEDKQ